MLSDASLLIAKTDPSVLSEETNAMGPMLKLVKCNGVVLWMCGGSHVSNY